MNWQEIRRQFPDQWLLVEALQAHSEANKRILDQLSVVAPFPDSVNAMQTYQKMHAAAPRRELYVVHSSRPAIDITERRWLGIRGIG